MTHTIIRVTEALHRDYWARRRELVGLRRVGCDAPYIRAERRQLDAWLVAELARGGRGGWAVAVLVDATMAAGVQP